MITVVVAANSQDKKFYNALQNILSRSFGTIHCLGRCLDARDKCAELILTDTYSFDLVYSETAIIIVKDKECLKTGFETSRGAVAVVDSCDKDIMSVVGETKLPAITCGLSARDTLTLSSFNEDSAVINIQRSISCFDGSVAEPQEIPVTLCSSIDSFTLMCAAAVFVLSGNTAKLAQEQI